jgi:hypothetical protein
MLEVAPQALRFLSRALRERQVPAGVAMRLTRDANGLAVAPDRPRPEDRDFDLGDETVLVVDQELADAMSGQRLSILEDPSGQVELHLAPS